MDGVAGVHRQPGRADRDHRADVANHPGAGAAAGAGFAALALLDAELRSGIELVLDLVGFDRLLAGADR